MGIIEMQDAQINNRNKREVTAKTVATPSHSPSVGAGSSRSPIDGLSQLKSNLAELSELHQRLQFVMGEVSELVSRRSR